MGFEDVLNGFRTEGGFSIFITGSNSYLLSGELATKLTGRYIEYRQNNAFRHRTQTLEVYPIANSLR